MPDNVCIMPNCGVDPQVLLSKAQEWGLDKVLVIGWDKDGNFIAGGSMVKLRDISFLLRSADNWVNEQMQR